MNTRKNFLHDLLMQSTNPQRENTQQEKAHSVQALVFSHENTEEFFFDQAQIHKINTYPSEDRLIWYHWVGTENFEALNQFLSYFHIHDLILEDIHNIKQQPKFEEYGDELFITTVVFGEKHKNTLADQVFLLAGKNHIITIQRKPLGLFQQIQKKLLATRLPESHFHSDFLLYLLLDRIVDDYFITADQLNSKMEKIDQKLFIQNNADILPKIHRLKRDAIRIKRNLMPIREGLSGLINGHFSLFGKSNPILLRDTIDHGNQLCETFENIRDTVQSMMDIYLSYQSNALNKQMRVLTSITIIFMPLTLIVGIYGMNFEHMPELHWRYGYLLVWLVMMIIGGSLLWFFNRRHWL